MVPDFQTQDHWQGQSQLGAKFKLVPVRAEAHCLSPDAISCSAAIQDSRSDLLPPPGLRPFQPGILECARVGNQRAGLVAQSVEREGVRVLSEQFLDGKGRSNTG